MINTQPDCQTISTSVSMAFLRMMDNFLRKKNWKYQGYVREKKGSQSLLQLDFGVDFFRRISNIQYTPEFKFNQWAVSLQECIKRTLILPLNCFHKDFYSTCCICSQQEMTILTFCFMNHLTDILKPKKVADTCFMGSELFLQWYFWGRSVT